MKKIATYFAILITIVALGFYDNGTTLNESIANINADNATQVIANNVTSTNNFFINL